MLPSFEHNGVVWRCKVLGERALLLENDSVELAKVHDFTRAIEQSGLKGIQEVIPAYKSLAVFFAEPNGHASLIQKLQAFTVETELSVSSEVFEIQVDYNAGLDWERVEEQTKLSKPEIIEIHTSKIYTVAMIGFLPGFIFLDGLDKRISVPRLETPRTNIPPGSVGIGGNQNGIYSLESPGGWNIIGQTTATFFDAKASPPSRLKAGDKIKFEAL